MESRASRSAGLNVIALVIAMVLFGTGPAAASPAETSPQTPQIHEELERFADELKAHGDGAIRAAAQAAQRAMEDNSDTISDLQSQWAAQLETFRGLLNDQKAKAKVDNIGEDAAAALDAWSQTTTESWADSWKEAWAEMHRSALEALDLFQEWLERSSASEPIPV